MAKLLSLREMDLFRVAVNLAVEVELCCPEVGMGPTREMIAKQVANKLSFEIDEDDIAEVSEEVRGS